MFPGIFEWVWDLGHLLFMGVFWVVILVLLSGVVFVLGKTAADSSSDTVETDDELSGLE
jgi:hypothetical protein